VLAAAEAAREGKRAPWRVWTLAGATAVVVVVLMIAVTLQRRTARMIPGDELAAAQKLAEWRAPSDGPAGDSGAGDFADDAEARRILSEWSGEDG